MKKSNFFFCLFFFASTLNFSLISAGASPKPQTELRELKVKVTTTDSAYTVSRILDETKPTLILLPGIFRGFLKEDEFLQVLNRRKINWIAWHTSRHPESLLAGGQSPYFQQVSSQHLADELIALKKTFKIKYPILVSLSYSSSLIPFISKNDFPLVIETAPMGTANENSPPSPFYENWRQWMGAFPIFGNIFVQSQEYWAYRGYWLQQTVNLTKTHPHYLPEQNQIAEGLAQLAYASKTFDLRKQDFASGPKRFWILGEKENKNRKVIQLEAIRIYENQTGQTESTFIVPNAGHVVPNENPEAYVNLLTQLVHRFANK